MSKQEKLFIRPACAGVQVRKPDGSLLADEGELLDVTVYWRRREREGGVVISAAPKVKPVAKSQEA